MIIVPSSRFQVVVEPSYYGGSTTMAALHFASLLTTYYDFSRDGLFIVKKNFHQILP